MTKLGWQVLLLLPLLLVIYGIARSLRKPSGGIVRAPHVRFLAISILFHAGLLFALDLVLITLPVVESHKDLIEAAFVKTFSIFSGGRGGSGPSWERIPEGPALVDPAVEPAEARIISGKEVAFDPALSGIAPTIPDALVATLPPKRVLFLPRPAPAPSDAPVTGLPRAIAVEPELPRLEAPPLERVAPAPESAPEIPVSSIDRRISDLRPSTPAMTLPPTVEPRLPAPEAARAPAEPIPPGPPDPLPIDGSRALPMPEPPPPDLATPARVAPAGEAPPTEPSVVLERSTRPSPIAPPPVPSGRGPVAPPLPALARLPDREPTAPPSALTRLPARRTEEIGPSDPDEKGPTPRAVPDPPVSPVAEAPASLSRTAAREVDLTLHPPSTLRSLPRLDPPLPAPTPPRRELLPRLDALPPPLPDRRMTATGPAVALAVEPPDLQASFSLRLPEVRKDLVPAMGGTPASEASVDRGLAWLAAHQGPAGNWSLEDFHCKGHRCETPGSARSDAAATGLALMAFLGAGHSPSGGTHASTVKRGVDWLVARQKPNGDLAETGASHMYGHALATIALCEALGLTADPSLREPAARAVRYIVAAQDPGTGGWRYQPRGGGDTSVFGWQLMALKSAEMAGLPVPAETYRLSTRWLDSVASGPHRELYAYQPGGEVRPSMTAEALLCRQYLGVDRSAESMTAGGIYLRSKLPEWNDRHLYYWYYATQVMYHLQGKDWAAWNGKLRDMLVESQAKDGPAAGSWDPMKPTPDKRGDRGGRLYETTVSLLILEVYYRHLPLYQQLSRGGTAGAD